MTVAAIERDHKQMTTVSIRNIGEVIMTERLVIDALGTEKIIGTEKSAEVLRLEAQVKSYEQLLGKIKEGYPSGKIHDHQEFFGGQSLLFGVVSDTHLGSTEERLPDLDTAYKIFEKEGVKQVYHVGDLVAGGRVYRGQENELKVWGLDKQVQYLTDQYPRVKGLTTYFITGNHDLSFLKEAGADIGLVIEQKRNDLVYLDQIEGDVKLAEEIIMRLWHGGGGGAYAKSYKMQRYIASLEGGHKPKILLSGHYHVDFYMMERNIHSLQVGAFERQTLWLKRTGLSPSFSAWLVNCKIKDGSINRFCPELLKFF